MNKFATIAAVAALVTLSACAKEAETVDVPANEAAAAATATDVATEAATETEAAK